MRAFRFRIVCGTIQGLSRLMAQLGVAYEHVLEPTCQITYFIILFLFYNNIDPCLIGVNIYPLRLKNLACDILDCHLGGLGWFLLQRS